MERVYLTGGTGFIGSHFIRNHLATGDYDLVVFARGRSDEDCTARVKEMVLAADADYEARATLSMSSVRGVPADITLPRLGLSEDQVGAEQASEGATFLHFASSLNFEEKNKDVIYDHNINGLRNAIDLAAS